MSPMSCFKDAALALAILLLPAAPAHAANPACGASESAVRLIDVGSFAATPVVADLNNDKAPDIVVSNVGGGSVSVRLNDGDGGFALASELSAPFTPTPPVLMDLNFDGFLDLAVLAGAPFGGKTPPLQIWKNNGQGGFTVMSSYAVETGHALAAGDFDGDLDQDLLMGANDQLIVMNNSGAGSFAVGATYTFPGLIPQPVVADRDGDGDADVAVPNGATILMFESLDGVFVPAPSLIMPAAAAIMFSDIDGDRDLDLIGSMSAPSAVIVRINDGKGGFGPSQQYDLGSDPGSLTVTDIDGDEDADVVGNNDGLLTVLRNDGAGVLVADEATIQVIDLASGAVAAGDFNADGDQDLVLGNAGVSLSALAVIVNPGTGDFIPAQTYVGAGASSSALVMDDFNGDEVLDMLMMHENPGGIAVYLGNGDGSFDPAMSSPLAVQHVLVGVADMDDDGDVDVVLRNEQQATVMANNGGGSFSVLTSQVFGATLSAGVADLGDFDVDGDHDLVVPQGNQLLLLRNNGRGALSSPELLFYEFLAPVTHVTLGDLNGDQWDDMLLTVFEPAAPAIRRLEVRFNDGEGVFLAGFTEFLGFTPGPTYLADIDGDQLTDVLMHAIGTRMFANDGRGGLESPVIISNHHTSLADLDGDGDVDFMSAYFELIATELNDGAGQFQEHEILPAEGTTASLPVAGDFDGDGDQDLAVTLASGLSVHFNLACMPEALLPADLDGDGDVDGFDLALLLGQWGPCPVRSECSADLDGNNVVNGFDLAILLATWT